MSKERLTYRNCIGGEAYLKYGLAAKWEKVPRYDILNNAIQKLAEYEDLEEQGLLLRLPCKVGNTFWELNENTEPPYAYPRIAHRLQHCVYALERLGKTTFLTQSEAEEKLRELEKE